MEQKVDLIFLYDILKKKPAFFHTRNNCLYLYFTWEKPMKTQISPYFSLDCQTKVKEKFANKEHRQKDNFFCNRQKSKKINSKRYFEKKERILWKKK